MLIKQRIAQALAEAASKAQKQGLLAFTSLPEIIVEHPQNSEHGDYASSLPLKLARAARLAPMEIAQRLIDNLEDLAEFSSITVAAPGFINFTLSATWVACFVEKILHENREYGKIDLGKGRHVQIEFVSVNPTGPLHVGHGRGAVMGSTLANVLENAGYKVTKEYYINDAGNQLDAFSRSLYVRYKQHLGKEAQMPDDGYMGNYMIDLAKTLADDEGDRFIKLGESDAVTELGAEGMRRLIDAIQQDLKKLGVEFDVWFSEKTIYSGGLYSKIMHLLKEAGYVKERENAVWFESSALGEDKDNVLVRSDGVPTYFAADIAYHYDKFVNRKFDTVIDIWGADHQGHISRMKAVMGALGIDPDKLKILICQLVTLKRGQEIVRVSKRSGDLIILRELMDEVGPDACRFVFLSRSADSQMDFDLELAKKHSAENPVYYVQYAHARISSILKLAQEKGIDYGKGNIALLTTPAELSLIKHMMILPEIIELMAVNLEPHHLPYYAQELATAFHSFYKQCRVVTKNQELSAARLKLVRSAQIVLARSLHMMGMTAPESM